VSPEAIAGFAAAAVGFVGIAFSAFVWWNNRRVRVHLTVREAWNVMTEGLPS
jgi:hypothetical protein